MLQDMQDKGYGSAEISGKIKGVKKNLGDRMEQKNPAERNTINFQANEMKAILLEISNQTWIHGEQ